MVNIVDLEPTLAAHPFARDMDLATLRLIVGCCSNAVYKPGEYIFREGEAAQSFYLIRHGLVALEIHVPQGPPITVETLEEGELFGWSWLVPPYRWSNDARAAEHTRLIKIDGTCLRAKMENDTALGYEIYRRFVPIMGKRLATNRMRVGGLIGDGTRRQAVPSQGTLTMDVSIRTQDTRSRRMRCCRECFASRRSSEKCRPCSPGH